MSGAVYGMEYYARVSCFSAGFISHFICMKMRAYIVMLVSPDVCRHIKKSIVPSQPVHVFLYVLLPKNDAHVRGSSYLHTH